MSISVFVISGDDKDWFALQAREIVKTRLPDFHVVICPAVNHLVRQIGELVLKHEQHIDQIDFHGHGAPGIQMLGPEILFDHTGTGIPLARKLSVSLTDYARVRLLGCDSVLSRNGAKLLMSLKDAFGRSVTVQGTVKDLLCKCDYNENGFVRGLEEHHLFSTTDINQDTPDAPSEEERINRRMVWMNRVREVMESHT